MISQHEVFSIANENLKTIHASVHSNLCWNTKINVSETLECWHGSVLLSCVFWRTELGSTQKSNRTFGVFCWRFWGRILETWRQHGDLFDIKWRHLNYWRRQISFIKGISWLELFKNGGRDQNLSAKEWDLLPPAASQRILVWRSDSLPNSQCWECERGAKSKGIGYRLEVTTNHATGQVRTAFASSNAKDSWRDAVLVPIVIGFSNYPWLSTT